MKKNEMIVELMNVYDENESLKNRIAQIEESRKELTQSDGTILSDFEKGLIKIGEEKLFDKITQSYYKEVNVSRNDETGELEIRDYKSWVENFFYKNGVPTHLAVNEVKNFFETEFRKVYEEQKEKAIQDLVIAEQE